MTYIDYKLAIEIDENRLGNRNIDYKTKRQTTLEQELGCKYITINVIQRRLWYFLELSRKYLGTSDNL